MNEENVRCPKCGKVDGYRMTYGADQTLACSCGATFKSLDAEILPKPKPEPIPMPDIPLAHPDIPLEYPDIPPVYPWLEALIWGKPKRKPKPYMPPPESPYNDRWVNSTVNCPACGTENTVGSRLRKIKAKCKKCAFQWDVVLTPELGPGGLGWVKGLIFLMLGLPLLALALFHEVARHYPGFFVFGVLLTFLGVYDWYKRWDNEEDDQM